MRILTSAPATLELDDDLVICAENAAVLPLLPAGRFDLVYIDPPFNTGRTQRRRTVRTVPDPGGVVGFGGRRHRRLLSPGPEYPDAATSLVEELGPRLREARRLLAPHGSLYLHLDYREAHRAKLLLDSIFGEAAFLNEIIWAYDFGAKPRSRWPAKHDTILLYVREPGRHHFDAEAVEREPYMAPGLVTPERAARGKLPTDVWWHTIVPTGGREKTGYPTQKPEGVVRRAVAASSRPGGWCLDFYAGSGTLGAVCASLGRRFVLVDRNPAALDAMVRRLGGSPP